MDWMKSLRNISLEDILYWLDQYEHLGPLPGILAPMLESFIPVLPLFAILAANAAAYGLWEGFLYSWLGTSIGSTVVFLLTRRFGRRFTYYIHRKYPKSKTFFRWIEHKGFTPLFILSSLPFSPSSLINVVSGLTAIPGKTFFIAVFSGKALMIFIVSLASYDIRSIIQDPWRLALAAGIFGLMWIAGKYWEARYKV
jgi:uncharacterized membrane protein YdjX (TVP38/TMEM64 family)